MIWEARRHQSCVQPALGLQDVFTYASIVDQDIKALLSLLECCRGGFDRFQVLEIELQESQVELHRSCSSLHLFDCFVDALFGTAGDVHASMTEGELQTCLVSDAAVSCGFCC